MSTKTTFKRIALVTVAALGLGVLSVAPSQAVVSNLTVTVTNGTAGLNGAKSDTTTGALVSVSALLDGGSADTVTVAFVARGTNPAGSTVVPVLQFTETTTSTSSGVDTSTAWVPGSRSSFVASESVTAAGVYSLSSNAANTTGTFVGANFRLYHESISSTNRVAGTYNYTIVVKKYDAGTLTGTTTYDAAIVIAAAASASETPSAAYTTAFIGSSANPTADAVGLSAVSTAGTTAANLAVRVRNASDTDSAIDTVTVSIAGPGLVSDGSVSGKSLITYQTGLKNYTILSDGNAGIATITVKTTVTGLTFTKSVSFYAVSSKTITATVENPVLAAGPNPDAISVSAVDANGVAWTGSTWIVASSAADALVAGSTTPAACSAWTAADGILCPVTAATVGTAKLKVIDASTVAAAKVTSNEVTVTVKAQIANSVKIAFDKSSYAPNEKALITVTPLDAAGGTMQGKSWTGLLAAGGITSTSAFASGSMDSLTATAHLTSSTTGTNKTAGSYTFVVYMPAASGDVTISATGGSALPAASQVKISATASVVNASVDAATDAANEATDAANAATDAALAAADAADAATAAAQDASDAVAALSASVSKLISSLRAQITSLTNLVIKIQKKVRA
jgi:hypothetical protein